jgi:hexosaminidase
LQVRLDRCDGGVLFTIPLGQATTSSGPTRLEASLPQQHGTHDVCFVFARPAIDPMWAIDTVQWLP